ncbi:hypothetical protein ABZ837_21295 [Streptomyces sp. NPDC047197]|uniref:hypothetical protein n=1 Tax=Streptomyces sp. NPDC047197 TaxID=3155477 RepID=UPI003403A8EB
MTSYPDFPAGASTLLPPAGCPAHDAALPLAEIDAHPDPRELYRQMRAEHGPVVPVTLDGVFGWLVIGFDATKRVMREGVLYSRSPRHWRPRGPIPADWSLALHTQERPNALFATGEEHTRLRGALTRSLGRTRPGTVRRYTRDRANRLIDEFCETGGADLVAHYAAQLPLMVLMRIFGFSERSALRLVTALPALLDGGDAAQRANQQIMDVIESNIAHRRRELGADAIAWLIEEDTARSAAEIARSNDEIREQVWLTLASAMGAMGNWISNGLERQVNSARLRNDMNHGLADIEGVMRATLWEQPPLQRVIGRWATRDTRLGEQDIAAGDMLVLDLAAVNQDPCMGSDAERAATAAHSEANLPYGAGEHECPFPDLAEAIAVTAVDCLLQRLPDVRLADGAALTWRPSVIVRALEALPVRFTPTARSVSASEVPQHA